jgi:hypothetical protein
MYCTMLYNAHAWWVVSCAAWVVPASARGPTAAHTRRPISGACAKDEQPADFPVDALQLPIFTLQQHCSPGRGARSPPFTSTGIGLLAHAP